MNRNLTIALLLIILVVLVILNNTATINLRLFSFKLVLKESIALLSFFTVGVICGLLLKGK